MFWKNLPQKFWVYPSYVWLIQVVMSIIVVALCNAVFPAHDHVFPKFWWWDSMWYAQIAAHGYKLHGSLQAAAFYPLYPILIRIVEFITTLSFKPASYLISNISFLAALIFLYKLVINEHGEDIAKRTLWLLTAFPAAFFFNCAYTESTNLLFLVLFFYCLQQKFWYRALVFGALSAIIHGTGMLLLIPALVYLWCHRKEMTLANLLLRIISLIIIPSTVVAYMIFLYFDLGTPFAFVYAHKYWGHKMNIPILHIFPYLLHVYRGYGTTSSGTYTAVQTINGACTLIMALMAVLILTIYRKKFSWPIIAFFVVTLLVCTSSGPGGHLDSFARYVVVLFPGFVAWAYLAKKEAVFLLSLSVLLPVKTVLMGMFANGYWIT